MSITVMKKMYLLNNTQIIHTNLIINKITMQTKPR